MKIAVIGPYYPQTGGVQVYSTMLVQELLKRGYDVTVVSYPGAKPYSVEKVVNVPTIPVKLLRGLSFIVGASLYLDGYDVILAQYATTSGTAALLAKIWSKVRREDLKYFVTFHGSDANPWKVGLFWRRLVASVGKASAGVITVSHYLKSKLKGLVEVKAVIPGGIVREVYLNLPSKEEAKEILGIKGPVVLSVGTLRRPKRFDIIPEIAKDVEANFLIIGEGPLRELIERKAVELGVSGRIRLLGRVPHEEVPIYYRAADVLLHPVESEGYGLVALESLAAGTPVVASKVGGIPEVVEDGVTGYLVEGNDPEVFTNKLNVLLSNEGLIKRFGEEGRRRYLNRDWGTVADSYVKVIQDDV